MMTVKEKIIQPEVWDGGHEMATAELRRAPVRSVKFRRI